LGLSVGVVFGAVIFLPFALSVDMMIGGYALAFISFIISVSALVTTVFFWIRAAAFKRFTKSES
jgi:hypothetical protein